MSDETVTAVVHRAHRHADLLAQHLTVCGLRPSECHAPHAFWLEVSAILQISNWEQAGLSDFLGDLPTSAEAWAQLLTRAAKGPAEFAEFSAATLMPRVIQVFLQRCSWDGARLLEADIAVGEVDEDSLAEAMAKFIWENRSKLQSVLGFYGETS